MESSFVVPSLLMHPSHPRTPLAALSLAVLLALATPPVLAQAGGNAARASQFYEDGLKRFENKDYAGATIQLKNSLRLDNRQLAVQVLLGKALLANREPVAAEVAFQEALKLGVNRAEVVVPLAQALAAQGKRQQVINEPLFARAGLPDGIKSLLLLEVAAAQSDLGQYKDALKTIEEVRALDPAGAESWMAEVPIRLRSRQFNEALVAADRAIERTPRSAEAHYLRATVLHGRGQLSTAVAGYDKALELDPGHGEARLARAGVAVDQQRQADAQRDVDVILKRNPNEPRAVYLQAVLAERAGNTKASRDALNRVTAILDPVPVEFLRYKPQVLILGGLAHHGLGQYEKAKPYFETVQRDQPGSPVVKLLGQMLLAEGNVDRAILAFEGYLRAFPADRQAITLLASAHMSQGRHARATQILRDALQTQDSPEMRAALGTSLARAGRNEDAVKEFEAAYAKDPNQIQAGSALVGLYIADGRTKKAVSLAEGLAKRRPNDAGLANLLGVAHRAAGGTAAARGAFERAAQLDSGFLEPRLNLARLEVSAGQLDAASNRLVELLRAHPENVDVLLEGGQLAALRGRDDDATQLLTRAADLSTAPGQRSADFALVEHHLRAGRTQRAQEAVLRLTGKAPDDLNVLVLQARVALADNKPAVARQVLTQASRNAGFDARQLNRVALLQINAGDAKAAAHTLGKALQAEPRNSAAQALMVDTELRLGNVAAADKRAREMVAQQPRLALGHALVGDVAAAQGQWPQATEAYRKAHQLEPSPGSALRLLRGLSARDTAAAARFADDWIKTHPRDFPVLLLHADNLASAGQWAAARKAYEQALAVSPRHPDALNNYAYALLALKDIAAAKQAATTALNVRPDAPHIIGTAGWVALKAGERDRALQLLRDARLRDPDNPDTRYFLASALVESGRGAEAREELRAALQSGRSFASAADARRLLDTLK
jgi:putative PEP-CTERM system TPR-repeat lipoprotein